MKLKRIAAPVLTILISTSSSFAYETTGLSTVCVGDCASKRNQLKAEAKADAVKKVKQVPNARFKETLDTRGQDRKQDEICYAVHGQSDLRRASQKYTRPRPRLPEQPLRIWLSGDGRRTYPLSHRCAPRHQIKCEKYDGRWVNGHCRAWCEDHSRCNNTQCRRRNIVTANENFADR